MTKPFPIRRLPKERARRLSFASALAMCLALAGCGHREAPITDRDRSEAIETLASSVIEQRGVPGIAIAVTRDGKLFQKLTKGSADLATRAPVSGATPFQLASTTKIFSSAAVLLLVAERKVHLDDPIGGHLDGLPAAWRKVTLRQAHCRWRDAVRRGPPQGNTALAKLIDEAPAKGQSDEAPGKVGAKTGHFCRDA